MSSHINKWHYTKKVSQGFWSDRSRRNQNKYVKWGTRSGYEFNGIHKGALDKPLIKLHSRYFIALGLLIITVCAAVIIDRLYRRETHVAETALLNLPPSKSTTFIIDETDGMTREQFETCMKEIKAKWTAHETGDQLTVYAIRRDDTDSKGKPVLLFSQDKPRDGRNASFIYENPTMIMETFNKKYAKPFIEAITTLNPNQEATSSPILETIRNTAQHNSQNKGQLHELIIFSNMLEKGPRISFYERRLESFISLVQRSLLLLNVKDMLAGTEVTVYRIADRNYGAGHENWWRKYFEYAGANYRSYLM
jgi:hypothetical protein